MERKAIFGYDSPELFPAPATSTEEVSPEDHAILLREAGMPEELADHVAKNWRRDNPSESGS